ncbi:eukaryotic translation initiation factor 4E-3-like isoform X2 [Paramacrobiotus metropolitanus]|uniref:eukaryotic translation initiation factor 4E-3-like isoform X2 n=1 Tax=Paramacrobiotus metropolitanus TaxID=2943436 RepID=UPI0024459B1F|nr:eukaryotic translation initiation factor 4E-3-like isoform X2 [Paramacrobiotus metropolitanus]
MSNKTTANPEGPSADDSVIPEKHPLATSWSFFYLDPDEARKDWKLATKDVLSFDTVEDFWALYHHITALSQLKKGSDYSMFRGGLGDMDKIRPEWEDPHNAPGGCWKMSFDTQKIGNRIDDVFRELLMMCVGENFGEYGEYVNGVVASARAKQFRLALWTRDDDKEHIDFIGQKLLAALPPNYKIHLEFVTHAETERVKTARGVDPRPKATLYKN